MYTNEFEEAFADFLDRHEYDEAENYLFSMVRLAFSPAGRPRGARRPSLSEFLSCSPPTGRGNRRGGAERPMPERKIR